SAVFEDERSDLQKLAAKRAALPGDWPPANLHLPHRQFNTLNSPSRFLIRSGRASRLSRNTLRSRPRPNSTPPPIVIVSATASSFDQGTKASSVTTYAPVRSAPTSVVDFSCSM